MEFTNQEMLMAAMALASDADSYANCDMFKAAAERSELSLRILNFVGNKFFAHKKEVIEKKAALYREKA